MEYNQFKQLLKLRGTREKETVTMLEDFIEKFPYCQTSRLLHAKALHDQDSIHYNESLKLAAAYATNREVLHDLIGMKTEEVEFEFPLSRKEEPAPGDAAEFKEELTPVFQREEKFEEWYSEDEITGRAFEEQKEKEKLVDPHEVIRQRLSEILGGSGEQSTVGSQQSAVNSQQPKPAGEIVDGRKAEEPLAKPGEAIKESILVSAQKEAENVTPPEQVPEVTDYNDPIPDQKKTEPQAVSQEPEKSTGEDAIMQQAEHVKDVLDTMGLEHAMEESILDSLEKLPLLVPEASQKITPVAEKKENTSPRTHTVNAVQDKTSPRSFTEWLKAVSTNPSAGFEEVHAPQRKASAGDETIFSDTIDDTESQLSDDELIEKFLLEDPKIVPSKSEFYSPVSQAKKSVMDHDDVVSETLAQIYLKQGNTQKARWCYEKLILLHPEKSAFFAALLNEIPEGE